MTQFLPPNLLALFAARDPIPYLPPADKLPHEKRLPPYDGVSQYLNLFEDPKDTPPPTRVETREEKQERKRREKQEQVAYKLEQDIALWDPRSNENNTSDPYKTLFVARVNFYSSEHKLRREFESYGPIKKIHLVQNCNDGKPRGYAFIEYEHERDMRSAYKHADGKKIDGRRVLVDVERARTVTGWLPRRLGGGLGGTRRGGPDVNVKISGREDYRERDDRHERNGGEREKRERKSDSRDRERRRKSRSRSRERPRRERKSKRSRSRDRDRVDRDRGDRDRSDRNREDRNDVDRPPIKIEDEEKPRSERRRSRSRDKERKRRRSRSKSRDRKRRDRDRDRKRGGEDRSERDNSMYDPDIQIKKEPVDDYPNFIPPKVEIDGEDKKENIRMFQEVPNGNSDYEDNE